MISPVTSGQIPQLKFSHINSLQGLSNSTIETIYQDSRGFMWFGTRDGLNKYDGYEITVFKNKPGDAASITDNYILCIGEDAEHHLWIGTRNGLNRFNREKNNFISYKHTLAKQSISGNAANSLYQDSRGGFWIGTADGCLNRYNRAADNFSHFYVKPPISAKSSINCITEDRKSTLWIGTDNGLYTFNRSTHSFTDHFKNGSFHEGIKTIQQDRAGNLWVGVDNSGLAVINFNYNTIKRYRHNLQAGSLSNDQVKCLISDHQGNIWTGSIKAGLTSFYRLVIPSKISRMSLKTRQAYHKERFLLFLRTISITCG